MDDGRHVERSCHAGNLGTDVADSKPAQRASDKVDTNVVTALCSAVGSVAGQAILDKEFAGQSKDEGQYRHGDRTAHASTFS